MEDKVCARGGEEFHRKQMGTVLDDCFVGVAFFSLKRYQLSHTCNALSPVIFSQLSSLKRTAKVPAVDLLKLNTLSGTTTMLLTPKSYDEHSHHFYMEPM